MSKENVETVRRGYELYEAGDLEGVAGLFSDDAELADAGGLGAADTAAGTRYGPEGFLRASEETLEAFEDYRVEAEEFIDAGEAVIVPVRISGRGRASGRSWRPASHTCGCSARARRSAARSTGPLMKPSKPSGKAGKEKGRLAGLLLDRRP